MSERPEPDTICARATPPGTGAIAMVRLSGPQAISLIDTCFIPHSRRQRLLQAKSHSLIFGHIVDPRRQSHIDDVLVCIMRGPKSYTGEDVVEINCHGSPAIVRRVLRLLVECGARLAEPGEFTRRAFENGQIDIAQAEAVCDLIQAQTSAAAEIALCQLHGDLSERLATLRQRMLDLLAELEAQLDFPEEDLPTVQTDRWLATLEGLAEEIGVLVAGGERGRLLREGARVVLVGKPNAGKSSLFNCLLGHDRAIVTPEPGTTRDTLESLIEVAGLPLTVIDTAGLRAATGEIERLGVAHTEHEITMATEVVVCVPIDEPWTEKDEEVWRLVADVSPVVALTKCDLPAHLDREEVVRRLGTDEVIETSSVTGRGIEALVGHLGQRLLDGDESNEGNDPLISSLRHLEALRSASEALARALEAMSRPQALELAAADLRTALDQVNLILGLEIGEEVLDRIFERFCIGK